MEQQLIIAGVLRMAGTSKKSGNTYDFCKATVLQPIRSSGPVQQAYGFEPQDMNCEPAVLMQLAQANFPALVKAELQIGRDTKVTIISVTLIDTKSK